MTEERPRGESRERDFIGVNFGRVRAIIVGRFPVTMIVVIFTIFLVGRSLGWI